MHPKTYYSPTNRQQAFNYSSTNISLMHMSSTEIFKRYLILIKNHITMVNTVHKLLQKVHNLYDNKMLTLQAKVKFNITKYLHP